MATRANGTPPPRTVSSPGTPVDRRSMATGSVMGRRGLPQSWPVRRRPFQLRGSIFAGNGRSRMLPVAMSSQISRDEILHVTGAGSRNVTPGRRLHLCRRSAAVVNACARGEIELEPIDPERSRDIHHCKGACKPARRSSAASVRARRVRDTAQLAQCPAQSCPLIIAFAIQMFAIVSPSQLGGD